MKIIMSKEQNDAMVEVAYFMADLLVDVNDEDYEQMTKEQKIMVDRAGIIGDSIDDFLSAFAKQNEEA